MPFLFLLFINLSLFFGRPGRLTDGPYTSYDLNTLLQATAGERRAVVIGQGTFSIISLSFSTFMNNEQYQQLQSLF